VGGYYEVYLNLPEGAKATIDSPYYAGNMSTFGADMSSRMAKHGSGGDHNMDGLTVRLDITDKMAAMTAVTGAAVPKITLVRAGVEDANGKVADFNKNAGLEIGAVTLKSE
jgi:hypothetical protein